MKETLTFELQKRSVSFKGDLMKETLTFELQKRSVSFEYSVAVVEGGEGESYEGPYEVLPKLEENIVLPTKGKTPREDITVVKIPQFETSNEFGGKTLFIGGK